MRRSPRLLAALVMAAGLVAPSALHAEPAAALHATRLDGAEVVIPGGLPAGRTLLLMGFRHADNRFKTEAQRAHFAPLFADAARVATKLDLSDAAPGVVVVERDGRVLAKAAGVYDRAKGEELLAALNAGR